MEIFKIKNLSFTYPTKSEKSLDNINLNIESGDFLCICGKSGCGKTTLLKLLKPSLAPHGKKYGEILFKNKNIYDLPLEEQASKIGFVLQNPENQIVTDKVWHELVFGLENLGYNNNLIKVRIAEIVAFFGIEHLFHQKTSTLSGGQKQILSLAAIMAMEPECLILDEPTSQLDPVSAQEFLRILEKINREIGTTIIISEHRLEDVIPLANKVFVMEDGKLITNGLPAEVGKELFNKKNEMFDAMPTPMKIFASVNSSLPCPISVKDGKLWLGKYIKNKEIFELKKEKLQIKKQSVAFELKNIWHRYEKKNPDIIKGLSLKGNEGEIIAVMGSNGAGKSTLLSIMAEHFKPYRGKVYLKNKAVIMPQNTELMFTEKTIFQDLWDASVGTYAEKKNKIKKIATMCHINNLLNCHPFDLSGGEKQRAALAKCLLKNPDILLLDEPTKGMDVSFKKEFAHILENLKNNKVCIVMVSHDVEFCAMYADRCAILFDGEISTQGKKEEFFIGNNFYTTAANRMARQYISNAILTDDVIKAIGGKSINVKSTVNTYNLDYKFVSNNNLKEKNSSKKILWGIIFGILFMLTVSFQKTQKLFDYESTVVQVFSIVCLVCALVNFFPTKNIGIKTLNKKHKLNKRTIISIAGALITIPLTIYFGIFYLDDRKYYFISMLVILQSFIPFAFIFEGRHPKPRELVVISVICALAISGRCAFFMLPQFKPIMAFVIISAVCFGGETGFLVGTVSAFVSNFFFGQGPWTPWQMFAFALSGLICRIVFEKGLIKKTRLALTVFSAFVTLIVYGGIMNPASVIMYQREPSFKMIVSSYIMGLPVDIVHAASTGFFMWFLAEPMIDKLERIKIKYGLTE